MIEETNRSVEPNESNLLTGSESNLFNAFDLFKSAQSMQKGSDLAEVPGEKPGGGSCIVFSRREVSVLTEADAQTRIEQAIDNEMAANPWYNVDNAGEGRIAKNMAKMLQSGNLDGLAALSDDYKNNPQAMMRIVNHLNEAFSRAGVPSLRMSYSNTVHNDANPTFNLGIRMWAGESPETLTEVNINGANDVSASIHKGMGKAEPMDAKAAAQQLSLRMRTAWTFTPEDGKEPIKKEPIETENMDQSREKIEAITGHSFAARSI